MDMTKSKQSVVVIIFIILSSLIITLPVSADEPIVYVDDDYDEFTPGWNITHFNDIQTGIENLEENLVDKNIGIFSYGSGCGAEFLIAHVGKGIQNQAKLQNLKKPSELLLKN